MNLENIIQNEINNLKEEIKKRAVFEISDEIKKDKNIMFVLADTNSGFNPPVITFYLGSMEKIFDSAIRNEIRKILSHEIIHTFQSGLDIENKEKDAYGKMVKMKFFKDIKPSE